MAHNVIHKEENTGLTTVSITEGIEIMANIHQVLKSLNRLHGAHLKVLCSHHLNTATMHNINYFQNRNQILCRESKAAKANRNRQHCQPRLP